MASTTICTSCGFELFIPLTTPKLKVSTLGLYNDARWPGRCIVAWNVNHVEHVDEVPPGQLLTQWWADVTEVVSAVRTATGSPRINFAILGNTIPHLHAHVIPRYPANEAFPDRPSWEDPRKPSKLPREAVEKMCEVLTGELGGSAPRGYVETVAVDVEETLTRVTTVLASHMKNHFGSIASLIPTVAQEVDLCEDDVYALLTEIPLSAMLRAPRGVPV